MEPELAVALPAAGAACATVLRPRPRLAVGAGAILGVAGLAAVILATPGAASDLVGVTLSLSATSRSMLIVAAISLAFVVLLAPLNADRSALLRWGLAGLAGMAGIAAAPTLDISVLVLLALVVLQAGVAGKRPYVRRLRAPAFAVALLGLGLVFARMPGPQVLERLGALGLVAGLVAALGALPYMHEFDVEERTATSPIPWIAFVGPVLAVVVLTRTRELIPAAEPAVAAMLIGLGLLNIAWGCVAAWRTELAAAAWRYSFIADWGLAMCGFGIGAAEGESGALLILYAILLTRLPLYLWSRQPMPAKAPTDRPVNLLVAAALAGSAPFAGFPARILLLRAASAVFWPFALVLAASLLLWIPSSLRLGRTFGMPKGRHLIGIAIALAFSLALGLYPQPLLSLAGR